MIKRVGKASGAATAAKVLEMDGCVVLEDLMDVEQSDEFRRELDEVFGRADYGVGRFVGERTKRVGGVFKHSQVAQEAALHPKVLGIADVVLGPNCECFQINLTQTVEIHPGEGVQIPHRDEGLFEYCKISGERMLNVMWPHTPFDARTGATRVVPGSHRWSSDRMPMDDEFVSAELQPGSALVWLGSLLHGGGSNTSDKPRRGTIISYNLGWLRSAENQSLTYPPDVARHFPGELQKLVGYGVHRPNVGLVENDDPIQLLTSSDRRPIQARDFLTAESEKLLAELEVVDG